MIRVHRKGLLALAAIVALCAVATTRLSVVAPLALAAGVFIDWATLIVPFVPGTRSK